MAYGEGFAVNDDEFGFGLLLDIGGSIGEASLWL